MMALTSLAYLVPLCVSGLSSETKPDVAPVSEPALVARGNTDPTHMSLMISTLPETLPEACRHFESARGALIAAGITPRSLAAAGVDPNQAAGVLALAQVEWLARGQTITAHVQACGIASAEWARLSDLALRGQASPEQAAALPAARDERDAGRAAREDALESFCNSVTQGLGEEQREALFRIKQNRRSALPLEYRVLNIDANQAGILRGQLAGQRIAEDRGQVIEVQFEITVGDQERADRAAADLAVNLDAVQAVWDATLGEP